jgi:hypothetical protein
VTARLREALAEAAEPMPPARLPANLGRRGRRARRRERLAALTVTVAAVLAAGLTVPTWLFGASGAPAAGDGGDAVPARLHMPWMWQGTVAQSPPGPASVLFSDDSGGLRGEDHFFDDEGKVAVVGRDGAYRMLLYGNYVEMVAGENVLLSPDGREVAHDHVASDQGWMVVTDLSTGESRTYRGPDGELCCGEPVAWAPDGRALLVLAHIGPTTDHLPSYLALLDLTTGRARKLLDLGDRWKLRTASLAAFSPDGRHIALNVFEEIRLLDTEGETIWRHSLGPRRVLAGVGAFTPGGGLVTTLTLDGCLERCDTAALAARRWRVGYLDARTGAEAMGPALPVVSGLAVRALGWRHASDLVVLSYRPAPGAAKTELEWDDTAYSVVGDVTLLALAPEREPETLLDPPDAVIGIDVARDLLTAGRFGGASPRPSVFPARWVIVFPLIGFGYPTIAVAGIGWALLHRWRRRRRTRR